MGRRVGRLGAFSCVFAALFAACSSEPRDETVAREVEALTSFSVRVPLPPGVPLTGLAVGASGTLRVGDRARTSATQSYSPVANLGSGTTDLGADSRVGNVWSKPSVSLRNRGRVQGDLRTGGTVSSFDGAVITGRKVEHAVLAPSPEASWTVSFPDTHQGAVALEPNQQRTLVPGSFGALSVKSGATLSLSSGTYYFTSAGLEPGSKLSVTTTNGPLVIYVRNSFFARGTVLDRQGRADILIGYLGASPAFLEAPFVGTVVAPFASLTLAGSPHSGAFFARDVELRPDATLTHKPFSALPPAACTGAANGTSCDDGNACTTVDRCDKGKCVGGSPVSCPATGNACVKAFCDPRDGQCLKAVADGSACNDGNPNTSGELCQAGSCTPPPGAASKECLAQDAMHEVLRIDPDTRARAFDLEKRTQMYLKDQRFNPESLAFTSVVTIPVVFHVLEHPTVPVVTDQQIADLLAELNRRYQEVTPDIREPFADMASSVPIVFELASRTAECGATTGIERIATSVEEFSTSLSLCSAREWTVPEDGGAAAWDPNKYLNIWVAKLANDFVRGMATFPDQAGQSCDGFVIQPGSVNTNGGAIAAHEIGHYLDLLHTETPNDVAETGCRGGSPETCGLEGDLICDTPATTEDINNCAPTINTCTDTPVDHPDQLENYMYSLTAGCRTMFSANQVVRMEGTLASIRNGLLGSDGFVPPVDAPLGDVWLRDGLGDEGQEPNDIEVVWASDDIWIRRSADGQQQHEDAVYRPGEPNRVYVRVRNRGCRASESNTVTLRWAKASTNLGWPAPWDGTETVPGGSAPMGDVIGTQTVGSLGPGESTVLEFEWEPPNPADYASIGAGETHFCLLSHVGQPSTAPQDLATLVRASNDITWKNVTVAADSSAFEASGMMEGEDGGGPQQMRLTEPPLPGSPGSLFRWGSVTIDLGELLFARWNEGGRLASGPVTISGTRVTISGATTLQRILLRAGERGVFRVRFSPSVTPYAANRSIADVYRLDVTQLTESQTPARALGGIRFLLKTRRPLPASEPPPDPVPK